MRRDDRAARAAPRGNRFSERSALPRRYVLYVGDAGPRKNLVRMLAAFARMREENAELGDVGLVLELPPDHYGKGTVEAIEEYGLGETVRIVEAPGDAEKCALYHRADLLFCAPRGEASVDTVLAAQALGTPVIAGDDAVLPQVAGQSAMLVDPLDVAVMARGLARLLTDCHLRMKLREKGYENVARFRSESQAGQA